MMYLDIFDSKRELVEFLVSVQYNMCYLCNEPFSTGNRPTIDHVIPLSRGGTWHVDNLKLAHKTCNARKGNMLLDEYVEKPQKRRRKSKYRNRPKR